MNTPESVPTTHRLRLARTLLRILVLLPWLLLLLAGGYALVRFVPDEPIVHADPVEHFKYGSTGGERIGSEVSAADGQVTVNYHLAAPPWVSVNRIQVYVNGRLLHRIKVDPQRNLADTAAAPGGPPTFARARRAADTRRRSRGCVLTRRGPL